MYINEVAQITRKVFRPKDKLNILCVPTHERYEGSLAKTGHNFYAMRYEGVKDWRTDYGPIPENYTIFSKHRGDDQIPTHITFDAVLSQNRFGQYQTLAKIAYHLNLPLICLEHTAFMPFWDNNMKQQVHQMRGNYNIFITDWSLQSWDWEDKDDTFIIEHCVNTDNFKPTTEERNNYILTVGNDYIGRDYVLNFSQYKRVVLDHQLPARPIGDTPGLSKPAKDVNELIQEYQSARIFFNTHHISPIPTSLLEAMACGCAVVSIDSCAIPQYIEHGKNGFLYHTDEEAYYYLTLLLEDRELAARIGLAARMTILEKCNESRFIQDWNNIFSKVAL
jgi:hypothetical protein